MTRGRRVPLRRAGEQTSAECDRDRLSRLLLRFIAKSLVVSFVVLAASSGCRAPAAPADDPGPPRALATPTFTATEAAFAANLNPLSGLPSDSRDVDERRPRAIAVSSWDGGGQPAGLQASEMVVEARVPGTGGLTAVSAEPPEARPEIGPLRSAAWPDLAVARAFDASLVAADASGAVSDAIREAGIPLLLLFGGQQDVPATPRASEQDSAPGWEYTDAALEGGRPQSEVMLPPVPPGAEVLAAAELDVESEAEASREDVHGVTWRYDPVIGQWRRLREGMPEVDAASGEGLVAVNLVLLAVDDEPNGADWWVGTGPAAILRDGGLVDARWVREGPSEPLRLETSSGTLAELRTGNTWLILVTLQALDGAINDGS